MPFDFSQKPQQNQNNSFRNTPPRSQQPDSGGFRDTPRPAEPVRTVEPDRREPSGGFRNMPERRRDSAPAPMDRRQPPAREPVRTPRAPRTRSRRAPSYGGGVDIPWRIIIPVVLGIGVLALLYFFWQPITEFLTSLIAWVLIILVVLFLFKRLLFGRRR